MTQSLAHDVTILNAQYAHPPRPQDKQAGAWNVRMNGDQVLVVPEQTLLLSGVVLLTLGAVIGGWELWVWIGACDW